MKKITVLVYEVGKEPFELVIEDDLDVMQELVGGYIECVPFNGNGVVIVCDEEGKIKGKFPNMMVNGDWIVGTFFVCGTKGENFVSITPSKIKEVMEDVYK